MNEIIDESSPTSPVIRTPQQNPVENTYYTSSGKKAADFLIGFFGIWIAGYIFGFLFMVIARILSSQDIYVSSMVFMIIFLLVLSVIGVFISFHKGRKFIGIGAITSLVLPLLFFGACLLVLSGLSM